MQKVALHQDILKRHAVNMISNIFYAKTKRSWKEK